MYDRPDIFQLLSAVRAFLQDEITHAAGKESGRELIAINLLDIIEREARMSLDHLKAEWARLNFVQNVTTPLPVDVNDAWAALAERNRKLCEEISAGRYDYAPQRAALFEHLMTTTRAHLEVGNPEFLRSLAAEDD